MIEIRVTGDYVEFDGHRVAKLRRDAPPSVLDDFKAHLEDIQTQIEEAYSNGLMDAEC